MKSSGVFFPQTLSNKFNLTGTSRLMPNTLALRAVQRHTAASMREQHGVFGGSPSFTSTKPNRLAHTPNLRVSSGQVPWFVEGVELTKVKKRMLRDKRRAALEAISRWCWQVAHSYNTTLILWFGV
uniref:Uncharacterized protein n=2 Tax=Cajanus cajan TaxID=3821 RepID=A0A151SKQ8_CAJCA|nr:hypothetical protein KK1_001550 [Cajanus cajan]